MSALTDVFRYIKKYLPQKEAHEEPDQHEPDISDTHFPHSPSVEEIANHLEFHRKKFPGGLYDALQETLAGCDSAKKFADRLFKNPDLLHKVGAEENAMTVIQTACSPYMEMQYAADLHLCKFIKSNDRVADAAYETWRTKPAQEGKIYGCPETEPRPLSWTTEEHAITFLRYGDTIAYADTSEKTVRENHLEHEKLYNPSNGAYTEYDTYAVMVEKTADIREPEVLHSILKAADDRELQDQFRNQRFYNDVCRTWEGFGGFEKNIEHLRTIESSLAPLPLSAKTPEKIRSIIDKEFAPSRERAVEKILESLHTNAATTPIRTKPVTVGGLDAR